MKLQMIIACVFCLVITGSAANADETDALIQLDKDWGSSLGPEALESLLDDDILTLGAEGLTGKAQMLEVAADDASDDDAAGPYVAGDYKVRFLSDDVAVMVHSTGGDEPHWSMHVWHKQDGNWQVAATAGVPIGE